MDIAFSEERRRASSQEFDPSTNASSTEAANSRVPSIDNEKVTVAAAAAAVAAAPAATPPSPSCSTVLPTPAVPDGGFTAWWQCFAAFCIYCNSWGLLNTYGVFQAYYQTNLLRASTASQLSWIGTVQSFFILFGALWAGPLFDWGYFRALVLSGSLMLLIGTFMSSLCTEYYQVLLSQGFLVGLGIGSMFTPTPGIVSQYFQRKRSWALGIAAVGASIGGIVYPILFSQLVDRIGFGWTMRVLGFIFLILQIPVVAGLKPRVKPAAVRKLFDAAAWRDLPFVLWMGVYFLVFVGLYVPYFYLQLQAMDDGIITGSMGDYLLPLLNAGGLFGRLAIGYHSDRAGPVNLFIVYLAVCTILLYCWIGIKNEAGMVVFSIIYGFFSGAVVSMTPTCVAVSFCPDVRQFGVRWSMICGPAAVGLLIGNPIAGAIAIKGYLPLQLWSATTALVATILAISARIAKVGWGLKTKL